MGGAWKNCLVFSSCCFLNDLYSVLKVGLTFFEFISSHLNPFQPIGNIN